MKVLGQSAVDKIKQKTTIEFYTTLYDKMVKGVADDFKDEGWITNRFYEGSYLDGYLLAYRPFGVDMGYNLTEIYTKPREEIIERFMEVRTKEPKKTNIAPFENANSDVLRLVNSFDERAMFELSFDVDLRIGGVRAGDVPLGEDMARAIRKQKEEKAKAEKKEAEKGGGAGDKKKTKEEKKAARLLKRLRSIKQRLRGFKRHRQKSGPSKQPRRSRKDNQVAKYRSRKRKLIV